MHYHEVQEYKMLECVVGSRAYGTNTPDSDCDIRGIFQAPKESFFSLTELPKEVNKDHEDIKLYELRKFIKLASDCNPNIIEILWTPQDCIEYMDNRGEYLIKNRDLFISMKAYHTFSGYAYAQIKRAKGQNKWVNNPWPKDPPSKEDYCKFIYTGVFPSYNILHNELGKNISEIPGQPFRPVSIKKIELDLSKFHISKVENCHNLYRLYFYGNEAKGVFRGDDNLTCEHIPLEDEEEKFVGILLYDKAQYDSDLRDWKNYWEWRKNRNESRYKSQEDGEIDYDAKNIHHCFRLLYSGKNILKYGEPIVRFEGEKLQFLKDIRNGKYSYEYLMNLVESEMQEMDSLKESSNLPKSPNMKKIEKLYREFYG